MTKLSVIGCGYLGAVHAASMAEVGHQVVGIDTDADKVALLSAGKAPFYEPGFDELLRRNVEAGRLTFSTDFADAADAEIHFIGVGTPQRKDGQGADLTYVHAATDALLAVLPDHPENPSLVAGKSTVPVGTAATLAKKFAAKGAIVAWNPEFLREGFAVDDTLRPDRLVYGLPVDPAQAERAEALLDGAYAKILSGETYAGRDWTETPKVVTDYATAELVKVAANSFLATKISFINSMAEICDATGGNVTTLAEAIGYDDRIGKKFLRAGVGFGGGCLPKDIRAFQARVDELGLDDTLDFLGDIDAVNVRQRSRVVAKLADALGGSVEGKTIAVLGAAFKPDSDDIRDSPAVDVARQLAAAGADVRVTDPKAGPTVARFADHLNFIDSIDEAVTGVDAIAVLTEWTQFRELDAADVAKLAAGRVVLDGRNCLDRTNWESAGFTYLGMGR
ncbi:UDP-glucose dehydrogenase family protein [Gulosibacter massiliensis]|uniref:UDP-glucose dehydrogenase family protein n=1 Tax=Gulosibacter massiliensis TaxID=2479839 RepID=UPI000F63FD03|nr:UDP-glucose/GDP-mannose dehydrogenase family protein [Gulosibacter massiliensis]